MIEKAGTRRAGSIDLPPLFLYQTLLVARHPAALFDRPHWPRASNRLAQHMQRDHIICIIIHQTHSEKSDWSRAFNQLTIACELDMINAISAADIAFIMSSSTSAWLLSPLECSPQKQNGWMLHFCFWVWIMWKMYKKTISEFSFCMISWIIKTWCLCYLPQPSVNTKTRNDPQRPTTTHNDPQRSTTIHNDPQRSHNKRNLTFSQKQKKIQVANIMTHNYPEYLW